MTQLSGSGFSLAARSLKNFSNDVQSSAQQTQTLWNHDIDDQLIDVYNECSGANWDGLNAQPVTIETLCLARLFLNKLPRDLQKVEISGEPDGDINVEWYLAPRKLLSVSISNMGKLHYAALIGDDDPRGTTSFLGEVPETIRHLIRRVTR